MSAQDDTVTHESHVTSRAMEHVGAQVGSAAGEDVIGVGRRRRRMKRTGSEGLGTPEVVGEVREKDVFNRK